MKRRTSRTLREQVIREIQDTAVSITDRILKLDDTPPFISLAFSDDGKNTPGLWVSIREDEVAPLGCFLPWTTFSDWAADETSFDEEGDDKLALEWAAQFRKLAGKLESIAVRLNERSP